jgi:hypothetical protein
VCACVRPVCCVCGGGEACDDEKETCHDENSEWLRAG